MRYRLNDKPPWLPMLLYGAQWWAVSLPCVVILGLVAGRLAGADAAAQIWYMRKLFWLVGGASIVQVLWGHRLPLVAGPASTLLIGMIASAAGGLEATYSAVMVGGALLAAAAWCGALSRLRFFFTPRIVAVILVLIAFTLMPTMLGLIFPGANAAVFHGCFALATVFALLVCNVALPGMWKSLTVLIGLAGGSLAYFVSQGFPTLPAAGAAGELFIGRLDVQLGPVLAFLFCFIALTINELGSVESIGQMLDADDMEGRVRRGTGLQGAVSVAAGGMGVIGLVDYSLSAGVISATGCASRYTLVPAALGLLLCGAFPDVVGALSCIPGPVMGTLMLYLMSSQLASGLDMLVRARGVCDFGSGMTVGFPLMLGLLIAFAPAAAINGLPVLLRPILGNGFVMGAISVIVLEHLVFRKKAA